MTKKLKAKPGASKAKNGKKAIQKLLSKAFTAVLKKLKVNKPSKETVKDMERATKKVAAALRKDVKRANEKKQSDKPDKNIVRALGTAKK